MAKASIANPARTAVQLVPSVIITEFVDAFVYDLSDKQYGALAGLLLLGFSYAQNLVEEIKGRALFKKDAP
jgi:hypothetical protein